MNHSAKTSVRKWPRAAVKFLAAALVVSAACAFASAGRAVEKIKIGIVPLATNGPVFIAQDKGYFAAEGLSVELVVFEAAPPIAVAVVSGDLDFGATGLSGGFYNLAGQGALRLISGGAREAPGFRYFAFVVSNHAYAGGLRSYGDLPGHSVAISQIGSPVHYSLALVAEKHGLDLKSMRILPLQGNSNQVSAIVGGQADAAVIPATFVMPAVRRGDMKLLGFVGDETVWQVGAVFTSTKTTDQRMETVERFLRAFRKGAREYHDAFTGPDGRRRDGPMAPAVLAILAKYLGQSADDVGLGIPYVDAEARLDVTDVLRQIAWYKSQGMLKGQVDGAALIDNRYVIPLPER